jgi:hypothetical protein
MPPASALAASGFAFVHGTEMRASLEAFAPLRDWDAFAASWDDLAVDPYLAGRGRYRRRRFGVFAIDSSGAISREPHQPHYQGAEYNRLFGGVERWFEPIVPAVAGGATLPAIVGWCRALFSPLAPRVAAWRVEVHQFRIEARAEEAGQPTPEGVHRDGVDFVLVLLVRRENIDSGTTTVFDPSGAALGSFTLTHPCDAALVDDHRVAHGVTPVVPLDPTRPGHRDVLVVTFRAVEGVPA